MIPTIEQIIYDLLAGKLDDSRAVRLIEQHIELARRASEDEELRDVFAMAATQGAAIHLYEEYCDASGSHAASLAKQAYALADAMLEARKR